MPEWEFPPRRPQARLSRWIKERGPEFAPFLWQDGYFALSIGQSGADRLRNYIATQKNHHRQMDFKDEVRELCRRYGLIVDERYVWD